MFVDPEAVEHTRAEALAARDTAKDNAWKVVLPPIMPGFKASPLDVGEFVLRLSFLPSYHYTSILLPHLSALSHAISLQLFLLKLMMPLDYSATFLILP